MSFSDYDFPSPLPFIKALIELSIERGMKLTINRVSRRLHLAELSEPPSPEVAGTGDLGLCPGFPGSTVGLGQVTSRCQIPTTWSSCNAV